LREGVVKKPRCNLEPLILAKFATKQHTHCNSGALK